MSKTKIILIVLGVVVLALLAFFSRNFFKAQPDNSGVTVPASQKQQPPVDENQARLKVKNRTEVVKYEADLIRLGSKAVIEVEDLEEDWNVHVFEIVKQGDSSHTTTFGWYRVNEDTGKVERDI